MRKKHWDTAKEGHRDTAKEGGGGDKGEATTHVHSALGVDDGVEWAAQTLRRDGARLL